MSERNADPEHIAHQYIEGYNERDEAKIVELFAPTINWDGQEVSRDEIDHSNWWEAFPDLQLDLHRIITDGKEAAFRFTVTGTHEGEFQGIDPTGESIDVSEMIMISVGGDGIDSLWFEWDELGFFTSLGRLEHPLV